MGRATGQTGPYFQISAGWQHGCALAGTGVIECWGGNDYGQGDDQTGDYVQVSAGSGHSCAITSTGAADCWGDNFNGRADDQPGPYGPYVPWAEVMVKKVIVGDAPADGWAFTGDLGAFTLPAAGGEQLFPVNPGSSVTITETDNPGWTALVSCAPGGETGNATVTLTPGEAAPTTCTFTNTLCQPGYFDNGTICEAAAPGYYVPSAGMSQQLPCPDGTTSGPAATACVPVGSVTFEIFIGMVADNYNGVRGSNGD
jgi:hypothetical protein